MPQYQETNGSWTAAFYYKNWEGKRIHTTKRGFKTKREAKAYEMDFLSNHSNDCTMHFSELAERYLDDTSARLRPTTLANRRFIVKQHFNPIFGNMPIKSITTETIRHWQVEFLKKGYSQTYMRTINNMLSAILNFARKYYNLENNPVLLVDKIGKARNNHFDFWTKEDFDKFLIALNDKELNRKANIKRYIDDYSLTVSFKTLFYTGMRLGEFLALTITDIDFVNSTIHVSKTYSNTDEGFIVVNLPFTDRSNRKIDIPLKLLELLKDYIDKLDSLGPTDRVFSLLNKSNLRRALRSGAMLAGIQPIRIHDLRHSHASLLINQGYNIKAISDRLGHQNIETTLNFYAHLYNNTGKEIAEKLNNLIE